MDHSNTDIGPTRVSLDELKDELSDRRAAASQGQRPWWVQLILVGGVGTVFAWVMLQFLLAQFSGNQRMILDNQRMILDAVSTTRSAQASASITMGAFAQEDRAYKELMLMVQRQTCRNVVQGSDYSARVARDACDVIRPPR
jgi:hypothetical protein